MLNLLPPQLRAHLAQQQWLRSAERSLLTVGLGVIFFIALLFVTEQVMTSTLRDQQQRTAQIQTLLTTALSEDGLSVADQQSVVTALKTMTAQEVPWMIWVQRIVEGLPENVHLTAFQADAVNKTIILKGTFDQRESLLSFQKNLKAIEHIDRVDLPIANLLSSDRPSFTMTLTINAWND